MVALLGQQLNGYTTILWYDKSNLDAVRRWNAAGTPVQMFRKELSACIVSLGINILRWWE